MHCNKQPYSINSSAWRARPQAVYSITAGDHLQGQRHGDAEGLGGLEIDDQLHRFGRYRRINARRRGGGNR
jgi:hypothetical protein